MTASAPALAATYRAIASRWTQVRMAQAAAQAGYGPADPSGATSDALGDAIAAWVIDMTPEDLEDPRAFDACAVCGAPIASKIAGASHKWVHAANILDDDHAAEFTP